MATRAVSRATQLQEKERLVTPRQTAPKLHSGLTRQAPKNERLRGRLSDMPLGFLPKDFIKPPEPAEPAAEPAAEPEPAPLAAPAPPAQVEDAPIEAPKVIERKSSNPAPGF